MYAQTSMPRPRTTASMTAFGEWHRTERMRLKQTVEAVADRAEKSPGTVSMYERGQRNPSRDMARLLAAALAPVETDEEGKRALINAGLMAAGFVPDEDNRDLVYEPAAERIAEAYKGATEEGRRMLEIAAEAVERAFSRDSIGRRVRDGD